MLNFVSMKSHVFYNQRIAAFFLVLTFLLAFLPAGAQKIEFGNGYEDADSVATDSMPDTDNDPELPLVRKIQGRIGKLLESGIFVTSTVGMEVYDLTADSVIYAHNARQLMRPASTLKMIVAVAALDRLGSSYKYSTTLYYNGETDSVRLNGNLYCRGGFDPAFSLSDMDGFVRAVKSLDVDTICGDIVADVSMKDADRLGEGWCWDDDNPVLSPLLVKRKDRFAEVFMERLSRAGIVVTGSIRTGTVPHGAREIGRVERPLCRVMERMMKRSDNLYAESMFYQLAADVAGDRTASARHGRRAVEKLVSKLGLTPSHYYIADGSGLSLYNYVSPHLEVAFLRHAYANRDIYDNLLPSMPVAGVDGTLSKRMRGGAARGNVKAKTGTVTGVSALAGYCTAADGHVLCFSIINMGIRHSSSGRNFQDRVCEALCRP